MLLKSARSASSTNLILTDTHDLKAIALQYVSAL